MIADPRANRPHRERIEVVRRMQAGVIADDPILNGMCEIAVNRLGADAAVVTLLLERDQVFIGQHGLRSSPGAMPRQHPDAMLAMAYFEELRMDENPAMARNPMVHGPHDAFRSVVTAPVMVDGAVVGALNVLTRHHRPTPYDDSAIAELFRMRAAIQTHLAFGVFVRSRAAPDPTGDARSP